MKRAHINFSGRSRTVGLAVAVAIAGVMLMAPKAMALDPWSNTINILNLRFTPVMGGAAQLDNETGLVWQTTPPATITFWELRRRFCENFNIRGQFGWRIPTAAELVSLIDPATGNAPTVFVGAQGATFWSGTMEPPGLFTYPAPGASPNSRTVTFGAATPVGSLGIAAGTSRVWCVRAPGSGQESSF